MRNRFAIAATVIVLVVIVVVVPGPRETASAAPKAGEVLVLFGQCFVETGGKRSPLRLGDAVHVGDAVEAEAEAKLSCG